ncbi:MAG: tRNA (N(6)-L-threonylcarbamoyladenosine(37)-C(2))-methylthiotransferase MtaB [Verrucomicrobia bacterium]|nr:tRNA (N(6)-L-threonylcarbamoyladenosine(37)-C(2))-methylthiotransferase MtaB [Verrucomicrobiota bacterium]MBS0645966.1 tRNA (N(6)-L-threonylcarbamoyladenosine(37)-C(2))-methylthiotransferase MtaB [Verrucomicrobiota bacterium]
MKSKTFRLATLGCRTNQYETQAYRDQLLAMGYQEAKEGEEADLCIVNTCTVTESADRSSRLQIRQLARDNPSARVVVTGCMAERDPDQVLAIQGVSQVVGNQQKEKLLQQIFSDQDIPEFKICQFEAHTRAFVKVQDGCNSFCTYCIIPYVRGRSRSRPIDEIIREVEGLVASGYKEVVITGINVGDYSYGLADLMRQVDQIPGLHRLRLSSIDPDEVDDQLLDVIVHGKTTCPSMHLVLQSGSNVVLKRMNRKYTRHIFLETVERLKKARPDFTFTTDVIVGFPGETEADFEQTLAIIQDVKFAKVHMFPFSPRQRTRAALYPQLPQEVIIERKQRLLRAAEKVAYELRNPFIGRCLTVLTEDGEGGHTEHFIPVHVKAESNQLVEVQILENTPTGLVGKIVT